GTCSTCPGSSSATRAGSLHRLLRCRDPRDDGFREAVDTSPGAMPDPVLVRGHIHHVAASLGLGHLVVALLVGEDHEAIALAIDLRHGLPQVSTTVRLRADDGVSQREATARRDLHDVIAEGEDLHRLANLARKDRKTTGRL